MMRKETANRDYIAAMFSHIARNIDTELELDFGSDKFVAEFLDDCDLGSKEHFDKKLNDWFDIEIIPDKWRHFIGQSEPLDFENLCDLLINSGARMSVWDFDSSSSPATVSDAILFEITEIFRSKNIVDCDLITNQTPLGDYLDEHTELFINDIARLAPESMPVIRCRDRRVLVFLLLAFFAAFLSEYYDHYLLVISCICASVISLIILACQIKASQKDRPWYDNISTFGDLARQLATASSFSQG